MKQTVTIEVANNAVLQILRNLAVMKLVEFKEEIPSEEDSITARYNEVYSKEDSSLEPCFMMAQAEVLKGDDW